MGRGCCPLSSLGDQWEGLSCAIGASVPGGPTPGETRGPRGAGHGGAPVAVLSEGACPESVDQAWGPVDQAWESEPA